MEQKTLRLLMNCQKCGRAESNSVHHRTTQYGFHAYIEPQASDGQMAGYELKLQLLLAEARGAGQGIVADLIELLIEKERDTHAI
jgi:hypothetical protein